MWTDAVTAGPIEMMYFIIKTQTRDDQSMIMFQPWVSSTSPW